MTAPLFLAQPPRFLFFTGKGGVGKTSLACASAVRLADAGRRVLLVSTDPASNIAQVFGIAIGNRVTAVEGVPGLAALEIDPQAAAQGYRDRIVNPVRGLLPDDVVKGIEEQLSGACTTEIAAFDEFTALLTDDGRIRQFDHVVFDTAPTGHTIRLLQLPGAWDQFLEAGKGDASCLGPLAGLEKQRSRYHEAVLTLADPARTRLVLVARAQRTALAEADRTARELRASGVGTQFLAVNGRHRPPPGPGAAGGCHRGRRQGLRDAHGQGGRGQDDRGRRDRRGTGEARLAGAPEHLGSGGAPVADAGGSRGQPDRQPHRPARGDGELPRARPARQGCEPRRSRPRPAGGGPAFALHGGDRRVPGVLARRPRIGPQVRGSTAASLPARPAARCSGAAPSASCAKSRPSHRGTPRAWAWCPCWRTNRPASSPCGGCAAPEGLRRRVNTRSTEWTRPSKRMRRARRTT